MVTDRDIQRAFTFRGRNTSLPWYPRIGDRNMLVAMFGRWGLNEGVEVGTYKGEFASIMLKSNPSLHLTCVDPWRAYGKWDQEHEDACHEIAMGVLRGLNATIVRKPSLEAVDDFADASLDFVFIDGDHEFDAAVQDIIRWSAKVKPSGLVMVHDFWIPSIGMGVIAAVEAYTRCHGINPWYITHERISPTAFWVKR